MTDRIELTGLVFTFNPTETALAQLGFEQVTITTHIPGVEAEISEIPLRGGMDHQSWAEGYWWAKYGEELMKKGLI